MCGFCLRRVSEAHKNMETNGDKFQLLLTYIKQLGLILMLLKVTLQKQKPVYQEFQWTIHLAKGHCQMNIPEKKYYHKQILSKEQLFQERILELPYPKCSKSQSHFEIK